MKGKLLAALGVALLSQSVAAQPKKNVAPSLDYAALAERIVSTTANIKEGEIVWISGGPQDLALVDELIAAVRKRGAYPLATYHSENAAKKVLSGTPEKYDTQSPKLELALTKIANVHIAIPAVRDPSIWSSISAERRAKRGKAEAPVMAAARRKNLRFIELGNGLAPSASRAKELGVAESELSKLFWDGVSADYTSVAEKCKALQGSLAKANEVRITAANGTDLKVKAKGRKVFVSDGVTTDAEIKAGGPAVQVWLPAGEVYFVPVPRSADGKIVDDRFTFEGKEVMGLTVDVKAGKATNVSAKSGWDAVKPLYDAAGPGKTEIGAIDFGCNPSVKASGKLETWVSAGTVTVLVGGNVWAGGNNKEPFALPLNLTAATVTVDGKVVIENGALK